MFLNIYLFSRNSWGGISTIMDFCRTFIPDEDFIPFLIEIIMANTILILGYFLTKPKGEGTE